MQHLEVSGAVPHI